MIHAYKKNERFKIDITYLPLELIENTNYKYLLNILDHFSKYLFSYLLSDKKADSIYKILNDCFLNYGYPKQIGCDNGKEFNDKLIKIFM